MIVDGISPYEYEHMRTVIYKMSIENMALKEQLKTHEELILASQEESHPRAVPAIYRVFFTRSFTSTSTFRSASSFKLGSTSVSTYLIFII
jgi:hypothetical protein